jgi:epoxyqueuosine reductase
VELKDKYTAIVKQKALEAGFDDCGISPAEYLSDHALRLNDWLDKGYHADMHWMVNHLEKRSDPSQLVPGAKSVISVLLNYHAQNQQKDPKAPVFSKYAYGKDYHKVVKKKLKVFFNALKEEIPYIEGRAFVDSAPVMEHAWASRSGLGWLGKNSLLISKKFGSFVFIGELIVNTELNYDSPIKDFCGNCTLCINECPTHAITADRTVDSNKCISYHTIENKNDLPEELKNNFFNRAFGCDICQDVCPWNRNLKNHNVPEFEPKQEMIEFSKDDWQNINEDSFNKIFESSAVKRTGFVGLKRNMDFLK